MVYASQSAVTNYSMIIMISDKDGSLYKHYNTVIRCVRNNCMECIAYCTTLSTSPHSIKQQCTKIHGTSHIFKSSSTYVARLLHTCKAQVCCFHFMNNNNTREMNLSLCIQFILLLLVHCPLKAIIIHIYIIIITMYTSDKVSIHMDL